MRREISNRLIDWYEKNKRELPWRGTRNPYFIWLSEIILQQTRVNQGLEYYLRFINRFPTIDLLAQAALDEVLLLWQGLGYYSRARNLHQTAKAIVNEYNGRFPTSYEELCTLKGIGPYTAAAIASMAFNSHVPVVDGNVMRVITRLEGITDDIRKQTTKNEISRLSKKVIEHHDPAMYNQAIMEFGALQCVPVNPVCTRCSLNTFCYAYNNKKVNELPNKSPSKKQKARYFNYVIVQSGCDVFIEQRTGKDIWHMLFQFPLIETTKEISGTEILNHPLWKNWFDNQEIEISIFEKGYRHILSHQIIHARFFKVTVFNRSFKPPVKWVKTKVQGLTNFAVPRLIDRFLNENEI